MALALGLLPFLLLELALRLCGVGHDTRLIVHAPAPAEANVFRFNPAADRAYYGVEDLWGPDLRPFHLPKPAGTYRVVVIGGSTVAGFPYPFELALPRLLEVVLQQQLPGRRIEVLNTGMTAIMSSGEVHVLRQAVACQPDLIVVHSGHNEFYGPGGSASTIGSLTPSLAPLTDFLKRQRSYQILFSLVHRPSERHLIETLPADINIPLNGPVFQSALQRFRENLRRMVEIAAQAEIPIMLSTVPSNLADLAPLQPTTNPETLRRLKEVARLMSYREYEPALTTLAEARRADPADPLLAYRQGECLEKLGRAKEAGLQYTLAANLDGCRFRAATPFLDVVGEVASGGGAAFCDAAAELRSRSRLPAPGDDFFLEHVHYNLEGAWQVASILGKCIVEDELGDVWRADLHPDQASRDKLLEVGVLDQLAVDSLTLIGLEAWPFNLSPARVPEVNALKARLAANFQRVDPEERELFADLPLEAMHQHLWLAMGDSWLAKGRADKALLAFQRHIHRHLWEEIGYERAAQALKSLGRSDEARQMLRRAAEAARGVLPAEASSDGPIQSPHVNKRSSPSITK